MQPVGYRPYFLIFSHRFQGRLPILGLLKKEIDIIAHNIIID